MSLFGIILAALLARDAIKLALASIFTAYIKMRAERKAIQNLKDKAYEKLQSEEASKSSRSGIQ